MSSQTSLLLVTVEVKYPNLEGRALKLRTPLNRRRPGPLLGQETMAHGFWTQLTIDTGDSITEHVSGNGNRGESGLSFETRWGKGIHFARSFPYD